MTMFLQGVNDGLADGDPRKCDCGVCDGTPDYRASGVGKPKAVKRCPECLAGKHQNCDGIADLDDNDNPVPCECDSTDAHPMRVDILGDDVYLDEELDELLHEEWTGYDDARY